MAAARLTDLRIRLARADRRAGRALRAATATRPGLERPLTLTARGLSPAFRLAVAALIAAPGTRATGLRALAAGVVAAMLARALRDAIGRRRPGARAEGGFPSRHAAAAVAIAAAVGADRPRAGAGLGAVAAVGLSGRVGTGDHDPADILAGAILGYAVAAGLTRGCRGR